MIKNQKFIAHGVENLDDESLGFVSGGVDIDSEMVGSTLIWASLGSACVSLACSVTSTVFKYKAKGEKRRGDRESSRKLKKIGNAFHDMSVGANGLCILSGGGLGVMEIIRRCE